MRGDFFREPPDQETLQWFSVSTAWPREGFHLFVNTVVCPCSYLAAIRFSLKQFPRNPTIQQLSTLPIFLPSILNLGQHDRPDSRVESEHGRLKRAQWKPAGLGSGAGEILINGQRIAGKGPKRRSQPAQPDYSGPGQLYRDYPWHLRR